MNKLIILLFVLFTQQGFSQITIEESFKTLKITGEMKSLSVKGEQLEKAIIEMSNGAKVSDNINISKSMNKVILEIDEPEIDFVIRVPKGSNVIVETDDIVYEGIFDIDRDQRIISIQDLEGMIDVITDGYAVNLLKNSNDMSVVSYMNITADSIVINDGASISMDSYWGDVFLGANEPVDALINMRAKHGMVKIDSLIILSDEMINLDGKLSVIAGDGNANILLHSERGNQVLLDLESLEIEMDRVNDDIRLLQLNDQPQEGYMLSQNEPNPWKKDTKIEYSLPEDGRVFFEFYNVDGSTIYSITKEGKKGLNKLNINRKMIPNHGVVYYSMKSGSYESTRKMIHVD